MEFKTVADFRKRLKEALDFAVENRNNDNIQININRGDDKFILFATYSDGRSDNTPSQPPAEKIIKTPEEVKIPDHVYRAFDKTCKNGHIVSKFGKCLEKDCKYS